jgi:aminoglycoside phosphotransferase (APT) family kinase protein
MERLASLIVDTPQDLTEEWFTAVLREGGTLAAGVSVTSARSELIGAGQVGMVLRSELSYDGPAGVGPTSVVVKLASEEPSSRQMGMAMGMYETETRFYKEIAPLVEIAVPHLHWGDVEPETGRITLVIEDLTGSAQVGDSLVKSTPEQAELAFAELVKLHAPLWNDQRLRSLPWLAGRARAQLLFDAVPPAIEQFKEAYGDKLEPEHLALYERLGPKAAAWPARALVDPLTVTHCDFRLDNMMFATAPDAPPVTILDWQTCRLGPPLLDHIVFLCSWTPEDRRAHERDLLRGYHEGLVAHGVRDFSFEDCLESYRRSSLYPLLAAIPMSLAILNTDRGLEVAAPIMRGAAELVQDLGAEDFLD